MHPETSLIGIPTELRIYIAEYLAGKSLKAFAATCKNLQNITDQTTKEKARLAADTVVLWDGIRQDRPRHSTQSELRDKCGIEVVDQTALKGYNCLISACRAGDLDAVRGVLKNVSPNPPELNGPEDRFLVATWYTPIDYAVGSDSTKALELFIAARFDFTRLNIYDALRLLFGRKPWNRAMADRLIENGLDIHQTDEGDNLLHILCRGSFDVPRQSGTSPLSLVMYLVGKGVEVERRNSCGASPLSLAIERLKRSSSAELLDLIRFLLKAGSGVNVPCMDHGYTALHVACEVKSKDVVQLLLNEFHADVDVRNVSGETPLYIALEENSEEICKVLMQKGASLATTFSRQGQRINYLERALDMNLQVRTFYDAWTKHFGYDRPDLLLVAAAALGDVSELEKLLPLYEAGQDNEYNFNVALTKAVEYSREGAIDFLLPYVSSITVVNPKIARKSTLEIAKRRSDPTLLKIMARAPSSEIDAYVENSVRRDIWFGANVLMAMILTGRVPTSIIMHNSQALLNHAVSTLNIAALKFLLQHVQQLGFDRRNLIRSAVHYNFLEGVELLLRDSNVDSSMLSNAVSTSKVDALKLMINAGADITAAVDLRHRSEFAHGHEMQPFAVAVSIKGLSEIMQILLAANVDPNTKDTQYQLSLLSWAVLYNYEDTVRCLITHGADVNSVDIFGRTALFYAAACTNLANIRMLLDAGAQPNVTDINQMTPLAFATGSHKNRQTYLSDPIRGLCAPPGPPQTAPYLESAQLLLRAGANAYYIDSAERSVLSHAAQVGSSELVQMFIDLGVDIDAVDSQGRTALSWACICSKDTAMALVAAGCDVSKADKSGKSPLQYIHCDTVDQTDAMVKCLYSRR